MEKKYRIQIDQEVNKYLVKCLLWLCVCVCVCVCVCIYIHIYTYLCIFWDMILNELLTVSCDQKYFNLKNIVKEI